MEESAGGHKVFVETEDSHAATHLQDTPGLINLLKEAVPKIALAGTRGKQERFQIDMGRVIGTQDLVETQEGDEVIYAKRPNRDRYSPFVKNREPQPTSSLVIRLDKAGENEYDIYTAYIGILTPSMPYGDGRDSPEGLDFWKRHALILGHQTILPETVTKNCPWEGPSSS